MIEIDKVQRQYLTSILQQLNIDAVDQSIVTQLMRVLGFEDDVVFAKSLLADQIISINAIHQGQYEKFLALEKVSELQYSAKCLLFSVFRRYGQAKIKLQSSQTTKQSNIQQLTLPNSNNIDQIIQFQKKMYQNLKHLIPKHHNHHPFNNSNNNQIPNQHYQNSAFRLNTYSPDNSLNHQYLSSIHNPLLPQFITHPTHQQHQKSTQFFSLRSELFAHSDDMFSKLSYLDAKKQMQQFGQFDSRQSNSINAQKSYLKEEEVSPKGFTAYSFSQIGGLPCKKIKKDSFEPVYTPQSIRRVKEKIQIYKRSLQQTAGKVRVQKDNGVCELSIKHSISEYLSDDKVQLQNKKQSKESL